MLFSPKFVNFFRASPDFSADECTRLATALSAKPRGGEISVATIRYILGSTFIRAAKALEEMTVAEICQPRAVACPTCGCLIQVQDASLSEEVECLECSTPIFLWDEATHELIEGVDQSAFDRNLHDQAYELDAIRIASAWTAQQQIGYLTLDLVSSQRVQRQDPLEYTNLLQRLHSRILPEALATQSGRYLILGGTGDGVKIAFLNPEAAYAAAVRFLGLLRNDYAEFGELSWYQDEAGNRPRFAGVIGVLPLPRDESGEFADVNRILVRGLNHQWDIHHPALTDLFRLGEIASPRESRVRSESWLLSLLITDEALQCFQSPGTAREVSTALTRVKVGKPGGIMTEKAVSTVLYKQTGYRYLLQEEYPSGIRST